MKFQRLLCVLVFVCNEGGVCGYVGCLEKKNYFELVDFELLFWKCLKNGKDCLG